MDPFLLTEGDRPPKTYRKLRPRKYMAVEAVGSSSIGSAPKTNPEKPVRAERSESSERAPEVESKRDERAEGRGGKVDTSA